MSENTPTNPNKSEPQGADSLESQTPEEAPEVTRESETSFGAEAIVNAPPTTEISDPPAATEAGQFRTAPMDMNLPFSAGAEGQSSAGNYPTQQNTRAYPQTRVMNTNPPQAPSSQGSSQQSPSQHFSQAYPPQPPHFSGPGNLPHPGYQPRTYASQYGQHTNHYNQHPKQHPAPAAVPGPNGQMPMLPMQPMQPPRRKKPSAENITYAPVTGAMPLTRDAVTEIPADGPIEWPNRRVGIVGVANLVLSAVMAVVWAWIPLGLLFTGFGGIFALGLGVLALVAWVLVQQGANVFERYRAELIYGDRIPVPKIARSTRESGFGRFFHNRWLHVKSGSFWRSTAHHYVKMLLGAIVVFGTIAGICGAIIGIFSAINPEGITDFFFRGTTGGLGRIGVAIGSLIVLASSVAILWFAPYLDRALDRSLLPPARTAALQAEVTDLDRARMAGIEAAGAERLRIERDLHDGAQPRLVALSMTLGMAKSKIDTDPERAKELVSEAHAEAKGIVNELRQLARGIHPAVLTDRGLDAAVSALAGRSTIPVEVDVRLAGRIDREAEAVAYFVVAECLTNITKHSGATHARVFIAPIETGVQIVVTDNGQGGARIDRSGRHTGIAGLVDRVEAARGTLNLTSPAGGPTTVVVEVPCAS
ncbi:Signal transduction histidine kinase [Brevibacterium sp. 239c]|uniref:sensor histidine kinase n=1 Tax=Brevibacterium sp. 239c TaxID=1965356 RepID=UPI000C4DA6C7|nr:sensor histidine kinase [Brevibacterium sp. 239c]SMX81926.1 Signal transduction histidine kinase [Brevibacterium sp. 239c]